MNLVDANVLLYAVNTDSIHHAKARRWLDSSLSRGDTVGFPLVVILAFLRIATRSGIFPRPLSVEQAIRQVEGWVDAPSVVLVEPGPSHLSIMGGLLRGVGIGGNLVSDAHLAALAIEHDAGLVTFDRDFSRFGGVRIILPG